ncbi:hypothetical protein HD554DRAFT_2037126 [Boletus coccyginus]|nr:hypothetical protein HD554DRAFT_2037126 [Boletus coccyginus]
MSEANPIRQHVSDTFKSDSDSSGSECDAELDVEPRIPLKDIKSTGCTITWCCDMFCDVNKVVDLVMLFKQEEQEDLRRKYLTTCTSSPQALAHYKKVYYTLIHEIPYIKTLIEDPSHASTFKTTLRKVDTMKPTINSSTSKLELRLNHA